MIKPSGKQLQKKYGINSAHALYREDGKWYHHLKKFPGLLFDAYGYLCFESEADYNAHPELRFGKDLHVPSGISKISGYRLFPKKPPLNEMEARAERVVWKLRSVELRNRDQRKVQHLKAIYGYRCQLCGIRIPLGEESHYIEVHHIKPLGKKHMGPDALDNMICVCPNDHVLLDLKAIRLEQSSFKFLKHEISADFLAYHNALVQF
ncbi:HNH endonuclease [Pedobacter nototheniae]|uniref:HNH endonuclease n=1 Tax=Pedobacter nototheniae TaxID=2488994 RepID=UPI00103EC09B|nr:HNH endonuclease [Pedobacter nototheniae]